MAFYLKHNCIEEKTQSVIEIQLDNSSVQIMIQENSLNNQETNPHDSYKTGQSNQALLLLKEDPIQARDYKQ